MGFVRNRIFKLVFEDPQMEGLEVRARSVPLRDILDLTKLAGQDLNALPDDERLAVAEAMLGLFAKALVSWNIEDEDPDGGPNVPLPADLDGLKSLEVDFAMEIVYQWMEAIMGVIGPLGAKFSSGAPSLEASLPMDPLPQSPPP